MTGRGRKVPGPRYKLEPKLLPLAAIGGPRARRAVAERMGWGEPRAESHIRAALRRLEDNDYVHTVEMDWDPKVTADVYGYTDKFGNWYVKLYQEHGRFVVVSFHAPEYDMQCKDGRKIKGEP